MSANIQFFIYIIVLLFASWCSLRKIRKNGLALKFISALLVYTTLSECLAAYMAMRYHNNLMVFHIYVPVSLALIALYYNYSIPAFRKYKIGYWVAVAGILAELLYTMYIQPMHKLNSDTTLFAGVCVVIMAIYTLYRIYMDEGNLYFIQNDQFWLSLLFLFYYGATFLIFGFMPYFLTKQAHPVLAGMYWALWAINLILYGGMGVIFLLTVSPKLHHGK